MEHPIAAGRVSTGEDALVARAAEGDTGAFADLIEPRLDRLLRHARAILGDEADARDATQDACISAWKNLPRLRDRSRFDPWLNRVLLNRCRDVLRLRRRSPVIPLDDFDFPDARQSLESATGDVMAAFDRLKVGERDILIHHHLHGRPVTEIARVLGIPEGTAKSRLHAARQSLARALERQP